MRQFLRYEHITNEIATWGDFMGITLDNALNSMADTYTATKKAEEKTEL